MRSDAMYQNIPNQVKLFDENAENHGTEYYEHKSTNHTKCEFQEEKKSITVF